MKNQSFTLVELLIVLSLIAILATVLIVTINPGKIMSRGRDTQRINDLRNLEKIMDILSTEQFFNELNYASPNIVYISLPDSSATCTSWLSDLPSLPSGWSYRCSATPTNIDGTGWIPIPFNQFPLINIARLFIDPINKPPYYYSFVVGGSYKLTAKPETNYFSAINDGGIEPLLYEAGTNKRLSTFQSGLILYLPFDEGGGTTAYDLSGFGNNGTLLDASSTNADGDTPPQWTTGKVGKALSFDGVDDYVKTLIHSNYRTYYNLDPNYSHTITVWIYTTSTFPYPYSPGIAASGCHWITYGARTLSIENGKLCAQTHGFYTHICSRTGNLIDGNVATGTWQFLTWTHQRGSTIDKLGINGNMMSFEIATSSYDTCVYGWRFGYRLYGDYFPGLIDEVRIYNRALSDAEIKALYEATK